MIHAFNALLECLVTGLFTALFIKLFVHLGIFPITYMMYIDPKDMVEPEEEEDI